MTSIKRKIGFTSGAMDLLHAGHILMLEEAKIQCDYLIVALQSDPTVDRPEKNFPVETIEERLIKLKGCKYVDEIIVYTTEAELYDIIKYINPDVRIVGADHKDKPFTGDDLPIPVYFNSREHSYSSASLRKKIYEAESAKMSK